MHRPEPGDLFCCRKWKILCCTFYVTIWLWLWLILWLWLVLFYVFQVCCDFLRFSCLLFSSEDLKHVYIKTLPKAQRTRGSSININQTSISWLNLNLKSWPNLALELWPRFNLVASAAKYWKNFRFKISLEYQFHNLDQTLCSKSKQKFSFITKPQHPICNKLMPTGSSSSTSAIVTVSTSFELASSHARVTSIKFTKQEWVSESVS